jgi:hypothetical protein
MQKKTDLWANEGDKNNLEKKKKGKGWHLVHDHRHVAERHEWLRKRQRERPQPRAEPADQNERLHLCKRSVFEFGPRAGKVARTVCENY